jgi:8-oxo-dGTP pyrophosphatase MutT (NUDIX family)
MRASFMTDTPATPILTRYVIGFAFTEDKSQVALIHKSRSRSGFEWQIGKLNGLGGKIAAAITPEAYGEPPRDAMVREFQEESGVCVQADEWELCGRFGNGTFVDDRYQVVVFRAFTDKVREIRNFRTDEGMVSLYRVTDLPRLPTVDALSWLVPLMLYPDLRSFHLEGRV